MFVAVSIIGYAETLIIKTDLLSLYKADKQFRRPCNFKNHISVMYLQFYLNVFTNYYKTLYFWNSAFLHHQ